MNSHKKKVFVIKIKSKQESINATNFSTQTKPGVHCRQCFLHNRVGLPITAGAIEIATYYRQCDQPSFIGEDSPLFRVSVLYALNEK